VAIPTAVAPGRLRPAGNVFPGIRLTTTVGEWTGAPEAMRYVWQRDGLTVSDSGWVTDTWTDSYVTESGDVGHVLTVAHQARNADGDSIASLADSSASVELAPLPPSFADHTAVFGPMVTLTEVYGALVETMTVWLPTFLRERERLSGRVYGSLPSLRGVRVFATELDAWPADQLPLGVIVAPGFPDALLANPDGTYAATLELGVSIVVSARAADETLALATEYGAALRNCLLGHRSLGGIASALHVIGERYDGLGSEDQRTIAAAEVIASVRIDTLSMGGGGPAVPFPDPPPEPDPGGPQLGLVETTGLEIQREQTNG
jgi:hypothetical protein